MAREYITENVENLIFKRIRSRFNISDEGMDNLEYMTKSFAGIESDERLDAQNQVSTANGLFQYTVPSTVTAANRLERFGDIPWVKQLQDGSLKASQLSKEDQTILFWADLSEKKGSDAMIQKAAEGDVEAMKEIYFQLHHTDPDKATATRANNFLVEESVPFKKKIDDSAFDSIFGELTNNFKSAVEKELAPLVGMQAAAEQEGVSVLDTIKNKFMSEDPDLTDEEAEIEAAAEYDVTLALQSEVVRNNFNRFTETATTRFDELAKEDKELRDRLAKKFNEQAPQINFLETTSLPTFSRDMADIEFQKELTLQKQAEEYNPPTFMKTAETFFKDTLIAGNVLETIVDTTAKGLGDQTPLNIPKGLSFEEYNNRFPEYFNGVNPEDFGYMQQAKTHVQALNRKRFLKTKYEEKRLLGQNSLATNFVAGLLGEMGDLPFYIGTGNLLAGTKTYKTLASKNNKLAVGAAAGVEGVANELLRQQTLAAYDANMTETALASLFFGYMFAGANRSMSSQPHDDFSSIKNKELKEVNKGERAEEELITVDEMLNKEKVSEDELTSDIKIQMNKKIDFAENKNKKSFEQKFEQLDLDIQSVSKEKGNDLSQNDFEKLAIRRLEIERDIDNLPESVKGKFATLKLNQINSTINKKEIDLKKAQKVIEEENINKKTTGTNNVKRKNAAYKRAQRARKDLEVLKNRKLLKEVNKKLDFQSKKIGQIEGKLFAREIDDQFTVQNLDSVYDDAMGNYNDLAVEFHTLQNMEYNQLNVNDVHKFVNDKLREGDTVVKNANDDIIRIKDDLDQIKSQKEKIAAKVKQKRKEAGCN